MNPYRMLKMAAAMAVLKDDKRTHRLGAVGLRKDGTIVASSNAPNTEPLWATHAEARLVQKLDVGATVFVARVMKDGSWAMAKPCHDCMLMLCGRGVRRVFWTTLDGYGCVWL